MRRPAPPSPRTPYHHHPSPDLRWQRTWERAASHAHDRPFRATQARELPAAPSHTRKRPVLDETRLVFESFDNSDVVQEEEVPAPLPMELWPPDAQSSPLLVLPQPPTSPEATGRSMSTARSLATWEPEQEQDTRDFYIPPRPRRAQDPSGYSGDSHTWHQETTHQDTQPSSELTHQPEDQQGAQYSSHTPEPTNESPGFGGSNLPTGPQAVTDFLSPTWSPDDVDGGHVFQQEVGLEPVITESTPWEEANTEEFPLEEATQLAFMASAPDPSTPAPPHQSPLPRPSSLDHLTPPMSLEMVESRRHYYEPSSCSCPCACRLPPPAARTAPTTTTTITTTTTTSTTTTKTTSTEEPRYVTRNPNPSRKLGGYRNHKTRHFSEKPKSDNNYMSEVGFNMPDFDTFGEFGSVIKKPPVHPDMAESPSSQFFSASRHQLFKEKSQTFKKNQSQEAPSDAFTAPKPPSSLHSANSSSATYLSNIVLTTELPASSSAKPLPPAPPLQPPPQATIEASSHRDTGAFPNMLPSSSAPATYIQTHKATKKVQPSEDKYQTKFEDTLTAPIFYHQVPLMKSETETVFHIHDINKNKPEERQNELEGLNFDDDALSSPQKMKVIFDFPCARSAVYDLNFVFKFCRKMGTFDGP